MRKALRSLLNSFELEESRVVDKMIAEIWKINKVDYLTRRTFDVHLSICRGELKKEGMEFKRSKGVITRVK